MLPELQQQLGRLIRDYLDFAGAGIRCLFIISITVDRGLQARSMTS